MSNTTGATKSTRCMLLEIPPELRNRIYDEVFQQNSTVTVKSSHTLPPLLKTCRTIHYEAIKMYYNSTTFILRPKTSGRKKYTFLHTYGAEVFKVCYLSADDEESCLQHVAWKLKWKAATEEGLRDGFVHTLLLNMAADAKTDVASAGVELSKIHTPWVELGEVGWSWKSLEEIKGTKKFLVTKYKEYLKWDLEAKI